MTIENNTQIQKSNSKKSIFPAIFFGFLTFIISPITATIILSPYIIFIKVSGQTEVPEAFNPIIIIGNLLNLEGLGGYFVLTFIFLGLFLLLGDFVTAIISYFIYHSKKLALITFVSALIFQILALGIILPYQTFKSQRILDEGKKYEESFKTYANIGDNIDLRVSNLFSKVELAAQHRQMESYLGKLYKKLDINISINISTPGEYMLIVQYNYSDGKVTGEERKEVIKKLSKGSHNIKLEFPGWDNGFLKPETVSGKIKMELFYLQSSDELMQELKSDRLANQNDLDEFLKNHKISNKINKSVDKKEIIFK